jgi:hypothetical protein
MCSVYVSTGDRTVCEVVSRTYIQSSLGAQLKLGTWQQKGEFSQIGANGPLPISGYSSWPAIVYVPCPCLCRRRCQCLCQVSCHMSSQSCRSWRQDQAMAAARNVSSHSPDRLGLDCAQAPKKKRKEALWKKKRPFPPWLSRGWWGRWFFRRRGGKNKVGGRGCHLENLIGTLQSRRHLSAAQRPMRGRHWADPGGCFKRGPSTIRMKLEETTRIMVRKSTTHYLCCTADAAYAHHPCAFVSPSQTTLAQ